MGTLTNLNHNSLEAAIASHIPGDPHPQYLLERLLALGLHHNILTSGNFDANTWNPNQNQNHKSAINAIHVLDIRQNAQGGSFSITNSNLPLNQNRGLLIDIDPFADQSNSSMLLLPQTHKTQFFIGFTNFGFFVRQQKFANWDNWRQILDSGTFGARRILGSTFTIDPPSLIANGAHVIDLNFPGAIVGDSVFASPIGADIWNTAQWPFEFPANVSTSNTVRLIVRNDWTAPIDLLPFQIRVIIFGF